MPEGFSYVPFNNIDAVKQAIDHETAAVMLEVIQGEGGLHIADPEFVKEVNAYAASMVHW